ncbi:MAG: hypothetical protein AB4038_05150 [Prochloraceae cyanobacterium]
MGPALRRAKNIEHLLKHKFAAKGGGLGQRANYAINNYPHLFPDDICERLNRIIHERNRLAHNKGENRLKRKRQYFDDCNKVEKHLRRVKLGWSFRGFLCAIIKFGLAGFFLLFLIGLFFS